MNDFLQALLDSLDPETHRYNIPSETFEVMTDRTRRVVQLAAAAAAAHGKTIITSDYVVYGLAAEGENVVSVAFDSLGATLDRFDAFYAKMAELDKNPCPHQTMSGRPEFTNEALLVLGDMARREAAQIGVTTYIAPEHVALAIVRVQDRLSALMLNRLGVYLDQLRQAVIQILVKMPVTTQSQD